MTSTTTTNTDSDFDGIPPFPTHVPTHPLLVIDYELLKHRDVCEIERLWKASTELGFWYLKNHGVTEEVDRMFEVGGETMDLPVEEKMKYEQGDSGRSFGYKAPGANAIDSLGTRDSVELINISKDDVISYPHPTNRTYPVTVNSAMEYTIRPFVLKSREVNTTILKIFEEKLGLTEGSLVGRHAEDKRSGCEARVIRTLPRRDEGAGDGGDGGRDRKEVEEAKEVKGDVKLAMGSHTDFGSLSFLHNRLGGLQVLPPNSDSWQYVKPIPGHAICNIGDALTIFSGGILRSNLHRVVPPPGSQRGYERWSLVFFTRPSNSVILRALVEESSVVKEAVEGNVAIGANVGTGLTFETGSTAEEWFSRRVRGRRFNNWKSPESWLASRGTERVGASV